MEFFALASLALVAGLVSFSSPCVLPLLPGYVSYLSGLTEAGGPGESAVARTEIRRRFRVGALLFVVGFSAVFTTLGAAASAIGSLFHARALTLISGTAMIVMGLTMTRVLALPGFNRQLRFPLDRVRRGPGGAMLLGAAFAFGWTPCVGPVLASLLATAATNTTATRGATLLLLYSVGLGLPFLMLAAGAHRLAARDGWLRRNSRRIEIIGGAVLAAMGIALITGGWTVVMSRVLALFARLGWPPI